MSQAITVAIDGPAGAGKSTVAKTVAKRLGYTLVDTGAIYRSVALLATREGVALDDDGGLDRIVKALAIRFSFEGDLNHVYLNDEDVTEAIRSPEISMAASVVSARKVVRDGLLELQRRLAGAGNAVLEGRDIGTVVFPQAQVKVFLDAAPEERARRRWEELTEKDPANAPPLYDVLAEVKQRDEQDMQRQHAPLKAADDALILDSTTLDIDMVVEKVVEAAKQAG